MSAREPSGPASAILDAGEVSRVVGGRLEGDPSRTVRNVAPIDEAGADDLGFLAVRRYLSGLADSRAGALLVSSELADEAAAVEGAPQTRIVVEDPYRALPPLLDRLQPAEEPEPGVHPTAVLGKGAVLGEDVTIGPYAVLEEGVHVGDGVRIGPHVVIGRDSRIGSRSVLHPHVVLYSGSELGEDVILHAGVRVGVDGFGYVTVDGTHRKIPQVGRCVIGDGVEVGANCTLDRGSLGETRVGSGTKLDNLVHLGHNVRIGRSSILTGQVGIAGSARVGDGVMCGGQSGIGGHLEVGDGARIGAQAGVIGDVEEGQTVSGFPARDHRTFLRSTALVLKLPELRRKVREMERRLDELEEQD